MRSEGISPSLLSNSSCPNILTHKSLIAALRSEGSCLQSALNESLLQSDRTSVNQYPIPTYVYCVVPKKNYKIPLIFGGLIVNFPFMAVFISDPEKTQQPLLCPDVHSSVRHNPMQQRPPESASLNWHTALWWVSIMAYVRSKEFQRKDALNIFLTGKQVHIQTMTRIKASNKSNCTMKLKIYP